MHGAVLRLMAWIAALAAAILLAGTAVAQLRVDPDDALLFDARVGGLQIGNGVRAFQTRAGICLDFTDVIDALQIAVTIDPGGRSARGWAFDEARRIEIDRDKGEARFGGEYAKLTSTSIWESRSGWCVLAPELGKWLGITFDADVSNAILTIKASGMLPVEAAAKRAQAANRLRGGKAVADDLPRVALPYRAWRAPAIDLFASTLVDRRGGRDTTEGRYEAFAAGELAWLSADARLSSDARGIPQALRLRLYRTDIAGRLLGPLHATEYALGDVQSVSTPLGVQATPGRGAAITNRPLGLSTRFDTIDFTGAIPNGWDIELYRNGELLRSETGGAIGRYEFRDVELRYGVNAFEIVQYGPQGQIRRQRRSYNIGAQAPTAGETWWYANLVEDRRDLIEFSTPAQAGVQRLGWRADFGVERGLGKGASIGVAGHRVPTLTGTRWFAEATARASLLRFLAEANVASDLSGGTAFRFNAFGQIARTNVSIEAIQNRGLNSERVVATQRSITALAVDKPLRAFGLIMPLRFDLRHTISTSDRTIQGRARLSLATRRFSTSLLFGWVQTQPRGGPARDEGVAGLLLNTRWRRIRLRAEADVAVAPVPRLMTAMATANWSPGRRDEVQATLGHSGQDNTSYGGVNYTRDFRLFSVSASGIVDSRGGWSAGLTFQASVGRDGMGRFGHFRSQPQATTGAIAVSAFRDLNGDGIRQPDEDAMLPPGLIVNDVPVAPPKKPRPGERTILVEGLDPAMPVRVAIDESAIPDPFEQPSSKGVAAVPRAGLVTPVELGIVGTSSVDGTLVIDGRPVPGELIELIDAKGQVAYRLRTEYDGFFSFERVRYGSYHLRRAKSGQMIGGAIEVSAARPSVRLGALEARGAGPVASK